MKKRCYKCKKSKAFSAFSKNRCKADGLQNICKSCKKDLDRIRYSSMSDKDHKERRKKVKNRKVKTRTKLFKYLENNPCVDCGEKDPVVLEFDHVKGKKSFSISQGLSDGYAWTTLLEEIKKCQVRCCNCHRKKTAEQFSWYEGIK